MAREAMSKRRQPQRLPPPIMHGAETIDAEVLLTEYPDELGLLLWKTIRTVRLWADLPASERSQLFDRGSLERRLDRLEGVAPEEIHPALVKVAAVLQPRARALTVARACREIAEWSGAVGKVGTAIEFMQAAAVVLPEDAELAHEVARLARTATEYTRAETWYRQAISRARKGRQWYEFSRSYIGMGTIFVLRGNYPAARKSLIRGLRAAKRFSIRPLAAAAYHELMVLAIQAARPIEVTRYAHSAILAYGKGNPRLPALAFDYGAFLMSKGHYAEALRTFRSVPTEFGGPADQLMRAAAIAESAGATGDIPAYHAAFADAEQLLDLPNAAPAAATAMLALARGAAAAGDLERAERVALNGHSLAGDRRESAVEIDAEALLENIREEIAARSTNHEQAAADEMTVLVDELEAVLGAAG